MTIVEPQFDFLEKQDKHPYAETALGLEPVLGIAPEAYYAVDMGSPLRNSFLFGHRDISSTQAQTGVSRVFIGVIQTTVGGVCIDNYQQFDSAPRRDGMGTDMPIQLVDAENDGSSIGIPTLGAIPGSTECSFVEIELTVQAYDQNQQVLVDAQPTEPIESPSRLLIDFDIEAEPLRGHAKAEVLEKLGFGQHGEPAGLFPFANHGVTMATLGTMVLQGHNGFYLLFETTNLSSYLISKGTH